MDKQTKILLNSLSCPICKGQIDYDSNNVSFVCVYNNMHYWLSVLNICGVPEILEEGVDFYGKNYNYQIYQLYHDKNSNGNIIKKGSTIFIRETDLENRIIYSNKINQIKYDQTIFDFRKLNKDDILNKIETLITFQ